jgi:ABC-type iron transport system FetAB permease component
MPEGDFPASSSELSWINVVISLTFVLFNIGVSTVFRLGIGLSLLIAGLRCVGQLALVASILLEVFKTKNPWLVSFICCAFVLPSFSIHADSGSHLLSLVVLNFLGTFEIGSTSTW